MFFKQSGNLDLVVILGRVFATHYFTVHSGPQGLPGFPDNTETLAINVRIYIFLTLPPVAIYPMFHPKKFHKNMCTTEHIGDVNLFCRPTSSTTDVIWLKISLGELWEFKIELRENSVSSN